MIEIAHHPKWGLVDYTIIRWNRPVNTDEATEIAERIGEEGTSDDQIEALEEQITELENELADEKYRWRARVRNLVAGLRAKREEEVKRPPLDPLADLFKF